MLWRLDWFLGFGQWALKHYIVLMQDRMRKLILKHIFIKESLDPSRDNRVLQNLIDNRKMVDEAISNIPEIKNFESIGEEMYHIYSNVLAR